MRRLRVTTPLLLGVLLGASLPMLLVVQFFLDRGERAALRLESRLEVRVEGQDPLILTAALAPSSAGGGVTLGGTGRLVQSVFPWDPTAIEATFQLRLSPEVLAAPGEHTEGWAASYRERVTTRLDGLGIPPVPCEGRVVLKEIERRGDGPDAPLSALDMALDLRCTSAGADLRWHSGDERTWTIEGPVTAQ